MADLPEASSQYSIIIADSEGAAGPGRGGAVGNGGLPESCTVLETPDGGGVLYLVGTVHILPQSSDDVAQVVRKVQPDAVVVELCASRFRKMRPDLERDEQALNKEKMKYNPSVMMALVRKEEAQQALFQLAIQALYVKITRAFNRYAGGEFRTAFREAYKIEGCKVILGDRDFNITSKRAAALLSTREKAKLGLAIVVLCSANGDFIKRAVEPHLNDPTNKDAFSGAPTFQKVIKDERDLVLAHNLFAVTTQRGGRKGERRVVVGVVGKAHVPGIKRLWGKVSPQQAEAVCVVPKPSLAGRIVRVAVYSALA